MKSLPLTMIDKNYPSYYLLFEDGSLLNTKSGKYLKMDEQNRYSLNYAGSPRPVHRAVRKLYLSLFGRAYHGKDYNLDIEGEEWLEIEGSKGAYYISNFGRVKSYCKHVNPRLLNPYVRKSNEPYLSVDIWIDGNCKTYLIHRLVAKHFLPDTYSEEKEVHHKDKNPCNNHVSNLLCVTREEHQQLHNRKEDTNGTKAE